MESDTDIAMARRRPMWAPWVRLVELPGPRLYLAADPDMTHVIEGTDLRLLDWLRQLDGNRRWAHQVAEAGARGIDARLAGSLLAELWTVGLLTDAAAADGALLAAHSVVVIGEGQVASELLRLMPDATGAGRGSVPVRGVGAGDGGLRVAVLVLAGVVATSVEVASAQRLQAAGVCVLAVGAGPRSGRVGPLTISDVSACLRCEDLERAALDRDWPVVARQLALGQAPAPEPAVASATAAEAVRALTEALRYLAGAGTGTGQRTMPLPGDSAVLSGVMESRCGVPGWTHRLLAPNGSCGCWWSDA
ncbi:MAG: hypothetical protein WCP28_14575 [Actinomycetes bacterium]